MPEIDPVIFDFKARIDGYVSSVKRATDAVDQGVGRQERQIKQLEREVLRANSQIGGSFRTLAGSLSAYFTGRQVGAIIDGFTRVQNSLRVAGLEGENLASVQERLLAIGGQYGVSLASLADLYGKSAQSATDLGASQEQLVQLTNATAQALKISGTSTAQASGAILGLSQALASGTVRAEEFNQVNEGGLRPLLQAAAASERWGGSVARLRADILDGTVSSQEFFRAIMDGSRVLEGNAAKATLTLAGAVQSLTDRIMVYVGSAASASGVTGALAEGIQKLSNNLETIAEALAVIGVALAGRYVAGMVAAAGATAATGTAVFALQARMIGAATTAEALAFAGAGAGRTLLAAFGGPVGIAITALTVGIAYLVTRTDEATEASRAKANADLKMAEASKAAADATERLANASEKERAALIASMQASRARAAQALQTARAQIAEARASLEVARANAQKQVVAAMGSSRGAGGGTDPGMIAIDRGSRTIDPAEAKLARAEELYAIAAGRLDGVDKAIADATRPVSLPQAAGTASGRSGRSSGGRAGGGSAADNRFAEEMARLMQEELRARADSTTSIEERADLERQILEQERAMRIVQVENEANYTRAQKDAQIAAIDRLFGRPAVTGPNGEIVAEGRPGLLPQMINREVELRQNDLAISALEAQRATLDAQVDLETNVGRRNDLERRALDIQQKIERARLDEAISAGRIAESAREELDAQQKIERLKLDRSQLTPLKAYAARIGDTDTQTEVERLVASRLEEVNRGISDALAKQMGVKDPLLKGIMDLFIQQVIIRPIADALSNASGGGGGILGGIVSGIGAFFGGGRASGGYVSPGQMYRVNEGAGAGRVEGFMPNGGGKIIPLGEMNRLAAPGGGQSGGVATVRLELSGDIDARIQAVSGPVAVEVFKAGLPTMVDASASETMRRAGRPRL